MSSWRAAFTEWKPIGQEFWQRIVLFTQLFCGVHVFNNHVAQIHQVMGPSMFPTLSATGDVLLLERLSTRLKRIQTGDLVIAMSPENPRILICKRVVGLEGDRVAVLAPDGSGDIKNHITVPKGHVWLQGDNLSNSMDSRHYGPVPYALLEGKVCMRVWPIHGWTTF